MQKFISGALALALMATAAPVAAQERGDGGRRGERSPPQAGAPAQPRDGGDRRGGREWGGDRARPPVAQQPPQAQAPPQAPQAPQARDGRGWDRGERDGNRNRWEGRDDRPDQNRPGRDRPDQNRPDQTRPGQDRDWNRGDRNDGRRWDGNQANRRPDWNNDRRQQQRPRYDRRYYPPAWHAPQRYRGWDYRPPSGFYARSWVFGDLLPRSWWQPQYRIDAWWQYGLPIPPIGYEWVRVGDDALLVDMFNGRVIQVARDLFW